MGDNSGGEASVSPPDPYQDRYLAHQARKRAVLTQIMEERHSDRIFAPTPVDPDTINDLIQSVSNTPSSCDRHGVIIRVVTGRDDLALLGGLLVGGVGWIHRAPAVLLLFGDPLAYKAGVEVDWMPFLDGGVIVEALYLQATALGLAACFVNPNVRKPNLFHFQAMFGGGVFVGAFAIGWPR